MAGAGRRSGFSALFTLHWLLAPFAYALSFVDVILPTGSGILISSANKQTGNRRNGSCIHREENTMTKQLALITSSYGGLGAALRIHAQQGEFDPGRPEC